jgi:uncharacterized membrane protein
VSRDAAVPGVHPGWYLAAGLVVVVVTAVGAAAWPTLPERLPVHWDGSGTADRYEEKSFGTVFFGPLLSAGLLVFLYVTALIIRPFPLNNAAPAGVDEQVHQEAGMDATLYFLALTAVDLSLLMGWISLRGWFLPPDGSVLLFVLPTLGFLAAMGGAGLLARNRYRRTVAELSA